MSGLMEVKLRHVHCFVDSHFSKHGECKEWGIDCQLTRHSFFLDNEFHGECKEYNTSNDVIKHDFYMQGVNITDAVLVLVRDINNITSEERVFIKLKFDIECLPEESL